MPKRDLDRMRELLLLAEQFELPLAEDEYMGLVYMDDVMCSHEDILEPSDDYQLWLMSQTGWIDVPKNAVRIFRITPSGHDYLDAVRDEGIWNKTKSIMAETGGNATLGIVKSLAVGFLKKKIALHTDIEL